MRILIFYASYGGGHLSAAKAIKDYIEKNYKEAEVKLCDCMKYINKPIEKFTTNAYKTMAKDAPKAWGMIYKLSDKGPIFHISNFNNEVMSIKLNTLLQEFKPDIIISTHPFSTQMSAYLKKIGKIDCKIASIMTDFASQNQWLVGNEYLDYIFVSNDEMKKQIVDKGVKEGKIYVTGIPLSARFNENFNREEIIKDFNLDKDKKTILFFGGGEFGLANESTTDILISFLRNLKDKYQMVIISGKNKDIYEKFRKTIEAEEIENETVLLDFTNKVPELMSISSLVVTKPGGLTSSGSLCSHLPMVIINPIPGQEEENAEYLVKHGVAIWLKEKHRSLDPTGTATRLHFENEVHSILCDKEKIENMRENTKKIAKPNSTRDIVETILNKKMIIDN